MHMKVILTHNPYNAWCLAMEPVWHIPPMGVLRQQEQVLSSSNPQCPTLRL